MEELQQNEALLDEQLLAEPDSELLSDEEGEEGGLYEHFNVTVDKGQSLLRLDKFLKARMERSSRNRIQAAIDSGNVLVNGSPSKSSYKVKPLDYIQVVMPYPRRDNSLIPQDIPLEIPYEDDDLLLVNKPAGMVVHPGVGNHYGTLVNALMYHCKDSLSGINGELRPGIVHRIDKDTSGLLIVAKNDFSHQFLSAQLADRSLSRVYEAVVRGNFRHTQNVCHFSRFCETIRKHRIVCRNLTIKIKVVIRPFDEVPRTLHIKESAIIGHTLATVQRFRHRAEEIGKAFLVARHLIMIPYLQEPHK